VSPILSTVDACVDRGLASRDCRTLSGRSTKAEDEPRQLRDGGPGAGVLDHQRSTKAEDEPRQLPSLLRTLGHSCAESARDHLKSRMSTALAPICGPVSLELSKITGGSGYITQGSPGLRRIGRPMLSRACRMVAGNR
jgi:hypothetical protein